MCILKIHKYGTRECLDLVSQLWGGVGWCAQQNRAWKFVKKEMVLQSPQDPRFLHLHNLQGNRAGTEPAQTKELHTLEHGPSTLVEKLKVHVVNPMDWTQASVIQLYSSVSYGKPLMLQIQIKREGTQKMKTFREQRKLQESCKLLSWENGRYIVSLK